MCEAKVQQCLLLLHLPTLAAKAGTYFSLFKFFGKASASIPFPPKAPADSYSFLAPRPEVEVGGQRQQQTNIEQHLRPHSTQGEREASKAVSETNAIYPRDTYRFC